MFGRLFGLRPLDKDKYRKSIYQPPIETGTPEERKRKFEVQQIEFKNKFPFRTELSGKKVIGLKTVVDSRKAFEEGVAPLLGLYQKHSALSTFFVAMGKDGKGESLFSLLNPEFYSEISKTERIKREGFKTAFSGLLSPARSTTDGMKELAREIKQKGHDEGFYGFSPAKWKAAVHSRSEDAVILNYEYGISEFENLFDRKAAAFAAPFFLCSNATILLQENFNFDLASDCRGIDPFLPVIDPKVLKTPQVPVTLPTIQEWLAAGNGDAKSFYDHILKESAIQKYPVLEISPLNDGIAFHQEFSNFMESAVKEGFAFVSLRELLGLRLAEPAPLPRCTLSYALVEGRRQEVTIQMLEV
jgi:undecaprenyl phosphate-alpha-L-ara4FN deformylase